MPKHKIDPSVGKKTQITKETAEKYRLAGLEVRRQLAEQRKVWERPADLTDEMLEFFEKFGFTGDRKKLIDNKYKLIFPALKQAYEKCKFDQIAKFFEIIGIGWAADAAQFLAAYNVTIKADEDEDKREPIVVNIKRFDDAKH